MSSAAARSLRVAASIIAVSVVVAGCGDAGRATASSSTSVPPARTRPEPTQPVATATPMSATTGGAAVRQQRPRKHRIAHFEFSARKLTARQRALLTGSSWHRGCPVGLSQLRYMRIEYWGFDKRAHLGEMVASASAAAALRGAFASLFTARFPIRRMRLVDDYGGSDYASIQADNTSAFNCRDATGSSRWSEHAYGLAVDIDPIENPYVDADGATAHAASRPYLNRSRVRPGMAVSGGTLVHAFDAVGWGWGGRWPLPTDYQHFSVNGR
jgi:D-alanyl-D-alanine carboxypeptidase